jgi:membrane protein involved in colicin uptake
MGYKQKYNSVAPMTTSNKAAKLGHTSSAIGMQTDDGVVVTGDASKIGGQTTMTEAEKKRAQLKKRIEERKIREANEKMQRQLETETIKAEIAKRRIAREQEKRKREGKDYIDPKTGEVVRRNDSPAQQKDPKSSSNVDKDGHYVGTRFHYADKKYDRSIRQMFEDSFKTAKAAGAKTFSFHHSGVKDPKTGIYKFKGGTFTTETK